MPRREASEPPGQLDQPLVRFRAAVAKKDFSGAGDFDEPVGELRLTGHHHVPCAAVRTGPDSVDLLVFSTYAFDQLGTLLDAAQEYGVALEMPGVPAG